LFIGSDFQQFGRPFLQRVALQKRTNGGILSVVAEAAYLAGLQTPDECPVNARGYSCQPPNAS